MNEARTQPERDVKQNFSREAGSYLRVIARSEATKQSRAIHTLPPAWIATALRASQ